ncbi:uncharacterized protein RAG0_04326 [Rhynchosporium agropyri]|uniref:Uncharacterized protein n=1 Tax=Rhynchosporium agropyri TaxID=914238 RepID=A0A1E1K880_9HELO|nr:uncharacterized protein RAG0_04326 [Rhynchosporium agropyri]
MKKPIPDEQTLLVHLWIVADDLEIFKHQNLALNELDLTRWRTSILEIQILRHVYAHTAGGSLIRQYCVRQYANHKNQVHNAESASRAMADQKLYPPDFMIECTALITRIGIGEAVEFDSTLDGFMVVERKVDWKA